MNKPIEILIQGNVSENEIEELKSELNNPDIVVSKLLTKSQVEQDFVQILLNDFNVISFTRDFILSGFLTSSLAIIRRLILKLEKRNKKIKNVGCVIEIKNTNNKTCILNFVSSPEKFEILIDQADKKINFELINEIGDERQIFISLDNDNTLKIQKL